MNLDSILHNYESIIGFDEKNMRPYQGPALFLNGGLSLKNEDSVYQKLFPNCKIRTIEGAGHYVHTDKPKITIETIAMFLENENN